MTANDLPDRLRQIVDALPLEPGMRVLEVGGAPGAAAREVARRVGPTGHVMVLDRSPKGMAQTEKNCAEEIAAGALSTLLASVEDFTLPAGTEKFDIAFAARVGALDGRHPTLYAAAIANITRALKPGGRLFVDSGEPLEEIALN